MSTRTCKGCGWVYPKDWPGLTCRFCHTKMTEGICQSCGEYSEKIHHGYCVSCNTAYHRKWRGAHFKTAKERFESWRQSIASIPTPYATLTEDQWLEACKHFGGCAYCGADSIDVRSMFIDFKEGGRYCAWNIIPACEKCETARKVTINPFLRMNETLNRGPDCSAKKYGFTSDNLQRIVDYLQSKMEVPDGNK